jgi:hypothetical protein
MTPIILSPLLPRLSCGHEDTGRRILLLRLLGGSGRSRNYGSDEEDDDAAAKDFVRFWK